MKCQLIAVFLAAIISISGITFTQEASFKVIGNSDTTPETITKRGLTLIFLKRKSNWPSGQAAVPVEQARNGALRQSFSKAVLDRSLEGLESYWQSQVFSGRVSPPKSLGSDAEMIEYVHNTPGAVGYVSASATTKGVQVISVLY